ncbi:MarR family transcriptional regulator [Phenylobacterium sp.]|uniref:MarR family winged helix-turn-helix transcriptional regulator n=1 Tax=Phenylobacterium sp. TaxID=1871053 RepID=UPI002812362B|nr:MarR family transcriptional regulator [Phenylobacterium sp.]
MAKAKAREKGGAKTGVPALDQSPSQLLHRAVQRALDEYAAEFGPGGITQRQYAVLAAVAAQEGATQTDLVRTTGIDRSTLADLAARMIAKGLLARERSTADARANAVRLTPEGQAVLADAQPKMAAADARLLKLIPGRSRREAFLKLLKDLALAGEAAAKAEKKPKGGKSKTEKAAGPKKKTKKAAREADPPIAA